MQDVSVVVDTKTGMGHWDEYYADIAIVQPDGTVNTIYNQGTGVVLPPSSTGGVDAQTFVEEQVWNPLTPQQTTHYYVADHLGSARMELAGGGWPVWNEDYAPYGQEINPQPTANQYKFTSYERDAESGLDFAQARHYASSFGRFMSPDPSGLAYADQGNPQSFNLYSYVLNNPLVNTDPTGMYCYYGSTDADVGDDSQYDMHSTQGECTAKDENGNQGQWIPDPTTNVTVNANGDGSVDTDDFSFDGMISEDFEHSEWQGDPDVKRIQQLASGITHFGIPKVCAVGLTARAGLPGSRLSFGVDANTQKGIRGAAGARIAQLGGVQGSVSIKGKSVSATVSAPIPGTPFTAGVSTKGSNITSVNVGRNLKGVNVQAYADISNYADPTCP